MSGLLTVQNLPLWVQGASSVHIFKMISSASRVMSRFWPDMPSTLNIAQSLGRPDAATPKFSRPLGEVIEHRDAVGEFGRVVIGQQEAAGAETDILGLQERLREQQIGRGMRFPGRGVVLADPGLLVAELIEPAQRLQVPVVTLLQPALRRMGRHREISDLHGVSSRCSFFQNASVARKREHSTPARVAEI